MKHCRRDQWTWVYRCREHRQWDLGREKTKTCVISVTLRILRSGLSNLWLESREREEQSKKYLKSKAVHMSHQAFNDLTFACLQISTLNRFLTLVFLFRSLNDSQFTSQTMLFLVSISLFILVSLPRILLTHTLEQSSSYFYLKSQPMSHVQAVFLPPSLHSAASQIQWYCLVLLIYLCLHLLHYVTEICLCVCSTSWSISNSYFYL